MDRLSPEQRHRNMQNVRSTGSKIECVFAKMLYQSEVGYIRNDKHVYGHPDFAFRKYKIAVFLDGDFWHGHNWEVHRADHKSNTDFWISKIERNIARDKDVNIRLEGEGWIVIRFWESEFKSNPDTCLNKVLRILQEKKNKLYIMDSLSIIERLNGAKYKMQFYGPHSLDNEGNIMPFSAQMAVISHYLHNRSYASSKSYEKKALGLMDDIFNQIKTCEDKFFVADNHFEQNLFKDFFSIPFPHCKNPKFTFIDLFAGIGGFRMALQRLGGRCVFSSEWDEQAKKTYMLNYGDVPFGDITKEEIKSYIPNNFDILCAGFPCQAFSLAGKRKGFDETRGTLFFDVAEIIRRKRPRAFFLENVKGLLIHDKGKTIDIILRVLRDDLDYYVPDPQIVNAMNFGVPQHRERVYIVGFRKDQNIKEFTYPEPTVTTKTFGDIKEKKCPSVKYWLSTQYIKTLVAHKERHAAKGNGFGYEIIHDNEVANAIVVGGMGRERNLIIDNRLTDFTPVTKIKGEVNHEGLRRMTPREWARLQGYPDDFIIGIADASAYKQFGNSVAVPAIQATAEQIINRLDFSQKNIHYDFSKQRRME